MASALDATHRLKCAHVCGWRKEYTMLCIALGTTKLGKVKVMVFGERNWKETDHIKRIRYVDSSKLIEIPPESRPKNSATAVLDEAN